VHLVLWGPSVLAEVIIQQIVLQLQVITVLKGQYQQQVMHVFLAFTAWEEQQTKLLALRQLASIVQMVLQTKAVLVALWVFFVLVDRWISRSVMLCLVNTAVRGPLKLLERNAL